MSDKSKLPSLGQRLLEGVTFENIQKYAFGHKKDGTPRSLYDIVKGSGKKKKKKGKKNKVDNPYLMYLGIKKKKKKKDKKKYWKV